ncbi:hypothetical protein A0H81_04504 [Grifola frondosa]|uniref:Uncharacterized protein n=1 Tax=Grifola frondosa TaxID=5627 RepID=A0A1C7MFI3_GRIFR|nr:hypothetical protein A0H81_04504 [Grifola frondosa]
MATIGLENEHSLRVFQKHRSDPGAAYSLRIVAAARRTPRDGDLGASGRIAAPAISRKACRQGSPGATHDALEKRYSDAKFTWYDAGENACGSTDSDNDWVSNVASALRSRRVSDALLQVVAVSSDVSVAVLSATFASTQLGPSSNLAMANIASRRSRSHIMARPHRRKSLTRCVPCSSLCMYRITASDSLGAQCPGCKEYDLDMSKGLFSHLASPDQGVIYGNWVYNS